MKGWGAEATERLLVWAASPAGLVFAEWASSLIGIVAIILALIAIRSDNKRSHRDQMRLARERVWEHSHFIWETSSIVQDSIHQMHLVRRAFDDLHADSRKVGLISQMERELNMLLRTLSDLRFAAPADARIASSISKIVISLEEVKVTCRDMSTAPVSDIIAWLEGTTTKLDRERLRMHERVGLGRLGQLEERYRERGPWWERLQHRVRELWFDRFH